jgi:AraC-like DNA-binding protein
MKPFLLRSRGHGRTISNMGASLKDLVAGYIDTPHRRLCDLREDGLAEVPRLGWYSYSSAQPGIPPHRHSRYLAIYFRDRGEQVFQIDDRLHHLTGGDLLVIAPGEAHSTAGCPCSPGIVYWLNVMVPARGHGFLGLSPADSHCLVRRFLELPDHQFKAMRAIKRLFNELFQLHDDKIAFMRSARMQTAVLRLLFAILDSAAGRTAKSQPSRQMAHLVQTIRECPQAEYRLKDLARCSHLSLTRFKERFKTEIGVSPQHFIVEAKVAAAQDRLRLGREPITQIAIDLGFVSSQYFATVFKRITGQTPRDYRKGAVLRRPSKRSDDGQGEADR